MHTATQPKIPVHMGDRKAVAGHPSPNANHRLPVGRYVAQEEIRPTGFSGAPMVGSDSRIKLQCHELPLASAQSTQSLAIPLLHFGGFGQRDIAKPQEDAAAARFHSPGRATSIAQQHSPMLTTCYMSQLDLPKSIAPLDVEEQHSKTPSTQSLTSEQLQAYNEAEQAEMACKLRSLENCLMEERERSAQLQNTFAHELAAQKDAHMQDIQALEATITKVMADNQRISSMLAGVCGQVHGGEKIRCGLQGELTQSTSASGKSGRSKSGSVGSTSSGEGTSSSMDSRHKGAIVQRVRALNKFCMQSADSLQNHTHSDTDLSTDSEHIMSSSSEDSPKSTGAAGMAKYSQTVNSTNYVNVD